MIRSSCSSRARSSRAALSAIVVAGGRSSRLGGSPKALMRPDRDGAPALVRGAVDALIGLGLPAHRIAVVGPEGLPLPDGVLRTREDPPFSGPAAALAAGALALGPAEPSGACASAEPSEPEGGDDPAASGTADRAVDPDGTLWAVLQSLGRWSGRDVLDIGCGTGFHLPRFAAEGARSVTGVEPHPDLAALARRRTRRTPSVSVLSGTAQALPVPDASVDVVHARWAYFFGPGSEPGLAELERILKPGGTIFIVDNDLRSGTFASWIREAYGRDHHDPDQIEGFWSKQGFEIERLDSCWRFENRDDLERVVHLEFPDEHAARFVANHEGLEIDYNLLLIHKTLPI